MLLHAHAHAHGHTASSVALPSARLRGCDHHKSGGNQTTVTGRESAAMERRVDEPEQAGKDGAGNPPPPPFLEVTCRSSGKVRRFAAGTTARYALHAVNRKLAPGAPAPLHVEAVKDGEEPVSFGPNALLADYGRGWKLQTVTEQDMPGIHQTPPPDKVPLVHSSLADKSEDFSQESSTDELRFLQKQTAKDPLDRERLQSTSVYVAKIALAFVFIFLLGGLFTYLLEKLPSIIQLASQPESL